MKALALIALAATPALAKDLAGVSLPESTTIEGQNLVLNGAGIRSKFMFKVYVGALYVSEKSTSPEEIISSQGPKFVKLQFLRDVDKKAINEAWSEGYSHNCGTECETFRADLAKLNAFTEDMKEKETLAFLLTPEKVSYYKNDTKKGEVEHKGFSRLVLSIFLGSKPADASLKKGLLGNN